MKISREMRSAINKRAARLASEAGANYVRAMLAEFEPSQFGTACVDDVADWVPDDTRLSEMASDGRLQIKCGECGEFTPLNEVVGEIGGACVHCYTASPLWASPKRADVCARCGRQLPDANTWQHGEADAEITQCPQCGMALPTDKPGEADSGFDATDHLAGF